MFNSAWFWKNKQYSTYFYICWVVHCLLKDNIFHAEFSVVLKEKSNSICIDHKILFTTPRAFNGRQNCQSPCVRGFWKNEAFICIAIRIFWAVRCLLKSNGFHVEFCLILKEQGRQLFVCHCKEILVIGERQNSYQMTDFATRTACVYSTVLDMCWRDTKHDYSNITRK